MALQIRDFAPDLGLSLAASILKESLFSIPHLLTLNLHKGRLPGYRGMPPAFWKLRNGSNVLRCGANWGLLDVVPDTASPE
jgi:methionyl-tRNA formyltransferase